MFEKTLSGLIKGLRASNGCEEEFICECLQEIKQEIRSKNMHIKSTAILKLWYLHMYGYSIEKNAYFAIIECMTSNKLIQKKSSYSLCADIFNEKNELVLLTTNLFRKDLVNSKEVYYAANALNCISCMCTSDLANDLHSDVVSLFSRTRNLYLQKKACICLYKIFTKCPHALRSSFSKFKESLTLNDSDSITNTTIHTCAVGVLLELCGHNANLYTALVPQLYRILLKSSSNWLTIKIIKIFTLFCPIEPRLFNKIHTLLEKLLLTTKARSVEYELLYLITNHANNDIKYVSLIKLTAERIKLFCESVDKNVRFLGIFLLSNFIKKKHFLNFLYNFNSFSNFQSKILEFVDDTDSSVRLISLSMLNDITTVNTFRNIAEQLITFSKRKNSMHQHEYVGALLQLAEQNEFSMIKDFGWYLVVLMDISTSKNTAMFFNETIATHIYDISLKVPNVRNIAVHVCSLLLDPHQTCSSAFLVSEKSKNNFSVNEGNKDAESMNEKENTMKNSYNNNINFAKEKGALKSHDNSDYYSDFYAGESSRGVDQESKGRKENVKSEKKCSSNITYDSNSCSNVLYFSLKGPQKSVADLHSTSIEEGNASNESAPFASYTSAPLSSAPLSSAPLSSAPLPSAPLPSPPISSAPISSAPISSAPISSPPISSAPFAKEGVASSGALGYSNVQMNNINSFASSSSALNSAPNSSLSKIDNAASKTSKSIEDFVTPNQAIIEAAAWIVGEYSGVVMSEDSSSLSHFCDVCAALLNQALEDRNVNKIEHVCLFAAVKLFLKICIFNSKIKKQKVSLMKDDKNFLHNNLDHKICSLRMLILQKLRFLTQSTNVEVSERSKLGSLILLSMDTENITFDSSWSEKWIEGNFSPVSANEQKNVKQPVGLDLSTPFFCAKDINLSAIKSGKKQKEEKKEADELFLNKSVFDNCSSMPASSQSEKKEKEEIEENEKKKDEQMQNFNVFGEGRGIAFLKSKISHGGWKTVCTNENKTVYDVIRNVPKTSESPLDSSCKMNEEKLLNKNKEELENLRGRLWYRLCENEHICIFCCLKERKLPNTPESNPTLRIDVKCEIKQNVSTEKKNCADQNDSFSIQNVKLRYHDSSKVGSHNQYSILIDVLKRRSKSVITYVENDKWFYERDLSGCVDTFVNGEVTYDLCCTAESNYDSQEENVSFLEKQKTFSLNFSLKIPAIYQLQPYEMKEEEVTHFMMTYGNRLIEQYFNKLFSSLAVKSCTGRYIYRCIERVACICNFKILPYRNYDTDEKLSKNSILKFLLTGIPYHIDLALFFSSSTLKNEGAEGQIPQKKHKVNSEGNPDVVLALISCLIEEEEDNSHIEGEMKILLKVNVRSYSKNCSNDIGKSLCFIVDEVLHGRLSIYS